jgi:hypothetical protein
MPSSALPLAYYGLGYAGFGAAVFALAVDPSLPGASFYQPRVVALVHLVTLAWLTGSILGSLYIVAPLALTVPMPVTKADWIAFGAFALGVSGMVAHFWINTYDGMAWSALLAMSAVTRAATRVILGLRESRLPFGVRLHVTLAFLNIHAAAVLGMVIGFDRSRGFLSMSPLAATFAHAHIAAVGFVMMLVIGLSYRLIPMMLPASMPSGGGLALSAVLLQSGVTIVAVTLMIDSPAVVVGAALIAGGVVSFVTQVRAMLARRMPRPPALPSRDWSTWQVHLAFACLVIAVASGLALTLRAPGDHRLPLMWVYGVAGLIGFLAQMVAGMQGRIVPLYAWYRAYAALGAPPSRPANALPSPTFARSIFLCWAAAIPLLLWGLPVSHQGLIRGGAVCLLAAVCSGAAYVLYLLRAARAV